jgi:uncharacterized protein YbjT (DUF2867 family)
MLLILITGATGSVGRSIVTQLRTIGQDIRIVTRDARTLAQWAKDHASDFSPLA